MKITILGTNGFLSNAVGSYFSKQGYELRTYGLNSPKEYSAYSFTRIDFSREELNYIEIVDSDIIIYTVGAGIQSNLQEGDDVIYNLNVNCPVRICNFLRKFGYKGYFLTFGSYFEMGKTDLANPFTEEEILYSNSEAINDYTVSKRMLSRFISCYKSTFKCWHFFLPTIYGIGENPKRLIPYTINSIRNGDSLHFTEGNQIREYVHVSEIPPIIEQAYLKNLPSGLYNVPGKDLLSVREIVNIIHHYYNKDLPNSCFGKTSRADSGMNYLALNGSKLESFIGRIEYKISITEALSTY